MVDEPGYVSIVAVGDVYPNARFYRDGAPVSSHFDRTLELLHGADLAFANFEVPLSNRGVRLEKLAAGRAAPEIAEDVGQLGFHVLNLANNHQMDYGYDALADTIEALEGQGIRCVGAGASLAEAIRPVVLEVKGMTIGVLSFSCLVPTGSAATDTSPGIAPIRVHSAYEVNPAWQIEEPGDPGMVTIRTWADPADRQYAEERVRELAAQVDFLILSLHWGYGATENLAEYQRPLGHALLDAGADVIFGNHAHAIHGIELHDGKAILYSQSSFLGRPPPKDPSELAHLSELVRGMFLAMSPDGYLASLDLAADRTYSVRIVPTSLDPNGLPELVTGEAFDRIAGRIIRLSTRLDTQLEIGDGALYLRPLSASRAT